VHNCWYVEGGGREEGEEKGEGGERGGSP
jgi:hypothetical protein